MEVQLFILFYPFFLYHGSQPPYQLLTNPSLSICLYETHMASHPHARTHKRPKKTNQRKQNKTTHPPLITERGKKEVAQ